MLGLGLVFHTLYFVAKKKKKEKEVLFFQVFCFFVFSCCFLSRSKMDDQISFLHEWSFLLSLTRALL